MATRESSTIALPDTLRMHRHFVNGAVKARETKVRRKLKLTRLGDQYRATHAKGWVPAGDGGCGRLDLSHHQEDLESIRHEWRT